jgi:hypothetical protein
MKRFTLMLCGIATAVLFGGMAQAQFRMRPPAISGIWNPEVGSGAEYQIDRGGGKTMTMQVAVVAKDTVDGKDGYWFETSFTPPNMSGEMVTKMFYYRDGDELVVTHPIMQMPGRPPMELPEMMQGQERKPVTVDVRKNAEDLGGDTVTTPAGTFSCEHYKMKDGSAEFWVKEKTGPWGLVKSVSQNGTTIVLTKVISDAKDKITGKPVPMGPMGMGRPQQP